MHRLGHPRANLALMLGLTLLTAGLEAQAQEAVVRVGVPALPTSHDPAQAGDLVAGLVTRQAFDTLVQYREGSSDVEPGLAAQWTVSRDGLTWSFRLREGVRFHDGTPLEAHHVALSLERQLFPDTAGPPAPGAVAPRLLRGAPGVVRQIRVPDARTVQVALSQPYAPLLTVLAHPALSVVLPATGADGRLRWLGTGPFRMAEAAAGRLVLEASPGAWSGPPRAARLVFLEQPDEAWAEGAVEAGGLDLLLPAGAPTRRVGAISVPGWRIGYLALQTEREPFSSRKIRQAVAAALDARALATALGPVAQPLQGFLPPGVWARTDVDGLLAGDPSTARRLLVEAGPARVGSTLLVGTLEPPLDAPRIAEAVREALAAGGIATTVRIEGAEAMRRAQVGQHDMLLVEAQVDGGDPHLLLYPLSASEGATAGPSASNLSFYRNPRLDDFLIRGSQLSFRPERQRVYARAQAVLAQELPWIPLWVRLHWALVRSGVRGLKLHPSGFHRLDRVSVAEAGAPLR